MGLVLVGPAGDATRALGAGLPAERFVHPPLPPSPTPNGDWTWTWSDRLSKWERELRRETSGCAHVVVSTLSPTPFRAIVDLEPTAWRVEAEWPLALWFTTLRSVVAACGDGASIVVVVERPRSLDAGGWTTCLALADGLCALSRSLAGLAGPRRVRVNVVTAQTYTAAPEPIGTQPFLASYPGTLEDDVAGAIRMLLSGDAAAITGTVLAADSGASWA